MKPRQLIRLGISGAAALEAAGRAVAALRARGIDTREIRRRLAAVVASPEDHADDSLVGPLAKVLAQAEPGPGSRGTRTSVRFRQWGRDIEPFAVTQMENACRLPISVAGALMPDAHQGYGLPIGGVLATDDAVIPYAVGVDIACRMKLSVLDLPVEELDRRPDRLRRALESETRFGVGATFRDRRHHDVLDDDWRVSPVTEKLKDKAWSQLGTSGSGNHFVEFGVLSLDVRELGLEAGRYLALLSHCGSRGTGAAVADHYSRLARSLHPELPHELAHLAWLELDSEAGREYWRAMDAHGPVRGRQPRADPRSHAAAPRRPGDRRGRKPPQLRLDRDATAAARWWCTARGRPRPARACLGVIPGSMASPGYVVRGRGHPESLRSAAHGAGRRMSRKAAKREFSRADLDRLLAARGVQLISAGLDEVPMAYKDIDDVMAAQRDLVTVVARFDPRLVKMAPPGHRPED